MAKDKNRISLDGTATSIGSNPFDSLSSNGLKEQAIQAPKVIAKKAPKAKKTKLSINFEKSGRGGKEVTVIKWPEYPPKHELEGVLKLLKKELGTGGTLKNNIVEIQGKKIDIIYDRLTLLGYTNISRSR